MRTDAVPFIAEEPGPYRLTFFFQCEPGDGVAALRDGLAAGTIQARSPEITRMKLVALDELERYDLFSTDARFLRDDLPRLVPGLSGSGD